MTPEKDLTALTESVRKQREIAQEALEQAKQIEDVLKTTSDPKTKEALEKIKASTLKITRDLVDSVSTTSSAVTHTITFIGELVKK